MASAATPSHHILSLRVKPHHDVFQLNRQSTHSLSQMEIITFEKNRMVTLVCDGLVSVGRLKKLDVLDALSSGLLELVEAGKDEPILFESHNSKELDRKEVPPKPSTEHLQVGVGLVTDTTSERWKPVLQGGKTYELRLSKTKGEAWCYYTDEHTGPIEDVPPSRRHPVHREGGATQFTVYDDPPPPTLSTTLKTEPEECSLSPSGPPFKFIIEFSTDSDRPITIDRSRTPFAAEDFPGIDLNSVEDLIYCEDIETGDEVDWPSTHACFDGDPHPSFPKDEEFVELLPGKSWRFEHILEAGTVGVGGLECLEAGRTYKARVSHGYRSGFDRWLFGRKDDLLKGTLEEKKKRWDESSDHLRKGAITFRKDNQHVIFKAV